MRTAIVITLALGLGGCTLLHQQFASDEPSDAQVLEQSALVVCDNSSRRLLVNERDDGELLSITAIDSASTRSFWRKLFNATPRTTKLPVTPGQHQLRVRYQDAIFYSDSVLPLDAQAGEIYRLQNRVQGLSVQFWFEDSHGQRVGTIEHSGLHNAG